MRLIKGYFFMKNFLIILLSILILPCFADEPDGGKILPSELGRVEKVQYVDLKDDTVSETKQAIEVKLITGKFKGETVQLDNMLTGNPYYDIKLKKNTRVILHAEDNGNGVEYSIEDIKRSGTLSWLSLLFCGLLLFVGKKKGLYSLVSIALTVLLITHALSPLILAGLNPVFATILICFAATAATMYFVGGLNAKSTSAVIGAVLSLLFAGLLSYITMLTAHLTGFAEENFMFLYTAHPELDFIGITISTMILATLGAVMDVAMSIASTINEIFLTDENKTVKDLFLSGMNVGRDIIGTMANTLILVYLGGSLPLLLLAGNIDMQKFINLNQVVTETASALIGSIAIVICVPFTAIAASQMIKHFSSKKAEDFTLD